MMNAPIKPQTLVPCVALSLLVAGGETFAQSIIPASDGTGTIVNVNGNEFVIEGGTLSRDGKNLFHSLREFGLDANQIATFLSNPQIQNVLGRVTGGNPSVIDGLVQVLGGHSNFYLMNPSGIVFGSNATLNVPGDFFATTAQGIGFGNGLWFDAWGDNDYKSLTGTPIEFDLSDRSGTIINAGDLAVGEGQNLALIGGTVINTGSLSAPEGNVSVVAMPESGRVRLVSGGNVLGFEIEPPRDKQGNPVAVRAVDLPALITGSGVETGVTASGNEISVQGTNVPVSEGSAIVSGELAAMEGNVDVLGDVIALIGAEIDVSGTDGGGNVRIGGDTRGEGNVPNAIRTLVDEHSNIQANGEERGNGGNVTIWADDATRFAGEITALGGREEGDGGFVEVSGLQRLQFQGSVDTSAPQGEIGTLLIDPTNIEIVASGEETSNLTRVDEFLDGDIGGDGDTKLAVAVINNATSNVILQASNDIILSSSVDIVTPGVGLTLEAGNFIQVVETPWSKDQEILTNGGDIRFIVNNTNQGKLEIAYANIKTRGGDFIGRSHHIHIFETGINTERGNLEIEGTRTNLAYSNFSSNGMGNITIQANGQGFECLNCNIDTSAGDGQINLTGSSTNSNSGIRLDNSIVVSGDGGIALEAHRGGIHIYASGVKTVKDGDIFMYGTDQENAGIRLDWYNCSPCIGSENGNITLIGIGENYGIIGGAVFESRWRSSFQTAIGSTGSGNIKIKGESRSPSFYYDREIYSGISLGGLSIRSNEGSINIESQVEIDLGPSFIISNGGDINITSPQSITVGSLDSSSNQNAGNIEINAGLFINTTSGIFNAIGGKGGGNVTLRAIDDIDTGTIAVSNSGFNGKSGNIDINSIQGSINTTAGPLITSSALGRGGDVTLRARENISVADIDSRSFLERGGQISLTTDDIITMQGNMKTNGNSIVFNAPVDLSNDNTIGIKRQGNIVFGETLNGQYNLNLEAEKIEFNGAVGNIEPLASLTIHNPIATNTTAATNITTHQDINIDRINSDEAINFNSLEGSISLGDLTTKESVTLVGNAILTDDIKAEQAISLTSRTGDIKTGNITTPADVTLTSDNAGITTGEIDTSATDRSGNVTLTADDSISSHFINAQSDREGGNVTIATSQFFQATNTFTDQNGQNASISVAGAVEGGKVKIYHGGDGTIPFIVGDPTLNGTEGEITRGNDTPIQSIETYQEYPYTHKQDSDRLQIVSVPQPHTPLQPQPTPSPLPKTSPDPVTPSSENPEPLEELDRGDNPIESLAWLIGDLLNAETTIRTDEMGDYAFAWQTTNPDTGEQVILSLDVDNPYTETENPPIADPIEIADIALPSLNPLTSLNFNTNPEQIVTDIEQLLETEYETYFGDNLTDEKVTAESIRDTLKTIEIETGTRAVIVYAIPFPDALQLVLVRPEEEPLVTTVADADSRSLSRRLHQFRSALLDPANNNYRIPARELYQWLIAPIESELEELDIDTLIFSMGAGLRSLPLTALHDGEQFLVEKYSLGTIPSVALTDTSYQSVREARILAMGAEEFHSFSNHSDLPSVPLELAAIVDPPTKGETFLNEEFTLANLRNQRNQSRYDIVHLATHASFQPDNDRNTYIQFWQEKIRLDALREARWYDDATVELLVLSACETALGDRRSEMGFAGLAVRSGVKSALASLWKINDFVTLPAIAEFYNQLARENVTIKAEALRQSQIALLSGRVRVESGQIVGLSQPIPLPPELHYWEGRDLSHPYFWAGYTAIGSPW